MTDSVRVIRKCVWGGGKLGHISTWAVVDIPVCVRKLLQLQIVEHKHLLWPVCVCVGRQCREEPCKTATPPVSLSTS